MKKIVNGKLIKMTSEELVEQKAIDDLYLAGSEVRRVASIDAKTSSYIYARYPQGKQSLMLAEYATLSRLDSTNPRLDELDVINAWINSVVAIGNRAELDGTLPENVIYPT